MKPRAKSQLAATPLLVVLLTPSLSRGATPDVTQLLIFTAEADQSSQTILIEGKNFLLLEREDDVEVRLAGTPLILRRVGDTEIWADLPAGLTPGTYLLAVSRGGGSVKNDSFNLTIGAVGPAGPAGPPGALGPMGPAGPKGDKGIPPISATTTRRQRSMLSSQGEIHAPSSKLAPAAGTPAA